jgi:hypothetical protein
MDIDDTLLPPDSADIEFYSVIPMTANGRTVQSG